MFVRISHVSNGSARRRGARTIDDHSSHTYPERARQTAMSENLIVVGFHGKQRASEVLGQLEKLTDEWALDLKDAVAAYRTDDGRLRIDHSVQPTTKEGAGWGVFIGGMIGALLAAPLTGGVSAAAAATTLGFGAATVGAFGGAVGA